MIPQWLWSISVITSPEAEPAVAELLRAAFKQPVSAYTDARTSGTTVTTYLRRKPSRAGHQQLRAGLNILKASGLPIGSGRIVLKRIPPQNWAESWKRHFKPIEIGKTLLIRPSWSRRRPRKNQAVIEIDPGLSFGTGHHPTTIFCLEQLASRRVQIASQAFLDLGTGSGILAIAAAKLGYAPVEATDFDSNALRIARRNGENNGLSRRIRFLLQDVSALPVRGRNYHSLVCANLTANLLLKQRVRIAAQLEPNGILVLAGILAKEFGIVESAYKKIGLQLMASRHGKEWRSGAFEFRRSQS